MCIYAQVEMAAWISLSSSYLPTTPSPMRVEAPPPTVRCHAIPWSTRTYKTRLKHVHLRIMHARRPRVLPSMDSDPIQFHLAPKPEISRTNYSRQRNSCTSCGSIQWRVRAWHVSYPVPLTEEPCAPSTAFSSTCSTAVDLSPPLQNTKPY
jgi:hypothetical protein